MHPKLYAQGDILLEPVDDIAADKSRPIAPDADGAIVLGRGERSGHRHAIHGGAKFVRDPFSSGQAVPGDLYVGHLVVDATATLVHEEHAPIVLPRGSYRVRRQRVFSNFKSRREQLVAD